MIRKSRNKQKESKVYHDAFEARQYLSELMKKIVFATDYGNEEDDYTKTINLDIGGGTLSYDPYYQKLAYYDDNSEYEIKEDDLKTVQRLIKEIEKRYKAFENGIKEIRTKLVKEIFDNPISKIIK